MLNSLALRRFVDATFGGIEVDGARRIIGEEHIAEAFLKYWIAVYCAGVGAHVSNLTRSATAKHSKFTRYRLKSGEENPQCSIRGQRLSVTLGVF